MSLVLVLLGGAIGAPLRYLADQAIAARHDSVIPWGTFAVNVTGSLILGAVAAAVGVLGAPAWLAVLVGTGVCGALTTFSTFGYETMRLLESGSALAAAVNVALSMTIGFAACVAGWALVAAWG